MLDMWFYASHGTSMWPSIRDYHIRCRLVALSTPSEPTLCLKDQQMGNDTIYPELPLTPGFTRWNKLPGCLWLKDKN